MSSSLKPPKIIQYLQSFNYQMAITTHNLTPQPLPQHYLLQLSRAYFITQQYQKTIHLCQQLKNTTNFNIYYETILLLIKSKYLIGEKISNLFKQFQEYIGNNKIQWRNDVVKQIKEIIQYQFNNSINALNRNQIKEFGLQFKRLYEKEEMQNPLIQCMPMFVVSARWFRQFEEFVGLKKVDNVTNPGPITHFQILDHRYNMLYDPRSQKKFTNYMIFPGAKVICLPRSCWNMLTSQFKGNQLKRYNVWVTGKPRQIITQIYLKRIKIKLPHKNNTIHQIQITKKQTWGGLIKKLKIIQGENKTLYVQNQNNLKPVPQGQFLQQSDTIDKIFVFCQVKDNKNIIINGNVNHNNNASAHNLYQCAHCGNKTGLKYCQCKSVKYCNSNCQKQDRDKHRKKCQLQCSHLKQKSAILQNFNLPQHQYGGRKGLVGLKNLGNTCYMNSGLQCLSNTKQITQYFMSNQFIKQINHNNPLGTKGNLACAYAQLIRQMWTGSSNSISPHNLKKIIGRFAGQFSGYGQQDSQEFISYLIDGLQQDLNLVKKKQTYETSDQIRPDQQSSRISQQNYHKRNRSYIGDLMAGQFKSTVICQKCQKKSICFDPSLLLTLSIPALRQNQIFIVSMDCTKKTKRIAYTSDKNSKLLHLRQQLNQFYDVGQKYGKYFVFNIVDLNNFNILGFNLDDHITINQINSKLTSSDVVLIAYQFNKIKENQVLYQVQIMYNQKKRCFSRYVNIPQNCSNSYILSILQKAITRYVDTRALRHQPSINDLVQPPQLVSNSTTPKIILKLKTKVDMLSCTSQGKSLHLHKNDKKDLYDCLTNFTHTQILDGNNKWYCNRCKEFQRASKQMEIYKCNQILVLALKRFNKGYKVKDFVNFPIGELDMGPYIKSNKNKEQIIYELYGVVNHYGTMGGGHYTAYCKNFLNNKWYEFDDSRVSEVSPRDVVSQNAYVLFYRRK